MGWIGIPLPTVTMKTTAREPFDPPRDNTARLFSRGDLSGTFIALNEYEIPIPKELLIKLVGKYLQQEAIRKLESLDAESFLTTLME